ncbi:hypothetical protein [Jannaschia donghaensis]|uniref:Efflux transporter, outer membrane factor (OMF) lipoprotein, NodT family n=1 Tax=Jannaschia donghaensis TaxID=420998 RepID=A0A0M6YF36_9RHOB|nr:hypothetical protein [Jannaschia donghaensis]CTQ48570.1 efflux transporter, outer membrane factor (OMF) lipoprotein, NodT family [Jannaschia donghaensis]
MRRALALFAGCAVVGPDFVPPLIEAEGSSLLATQIPRALPDEWWRALKDPALDKVIEAAEVGNLDLAIARTRIDATRAALQERGLES